MKIKNQKGFGAIEILVLIVVIGVASFGGYYVAHHQDKTKPAASSITGGGKGGKSGPDTGVAKTEVYIIPEWKVSAAISTPPTDAALIQYKINDTQPASAGFTTQELVDADKADCSADNAPAGMIVRSLAADKFITPDGQDSGSTVAQQFASSPIQPYKVVDGYYYWYISSQAACGPTTQDGQLQTDAATQVKAIVSHLAQE